MTDSPHFLTKTRRDVTTGTLRWLKGMPKDEFIPTGSGMRPLALKYDTYGRLAEALDELGPDPSPDTVVEFFEDWIGGSTRPVCSHCDKHVDLTVYLSADYYDEDGESVGAWVCASCLQGALSTLESHA